MGRINPDDLPDTPIERRPAPAADPPRATITPQVDVFLREVLELTSTANWAEDTLNGIYESVRRSGVITEGQRRAVANIEAAANRSAGRRDRWQRRWDRDR
jgi:hypothetical protein